MQILIDMRVCDEVDRDELSIFDQVLMILACNYSKTLVYDEVVHDEGAINEC